MQVDPKIVAAMRVAEIPDVSKPGWASVYVGNILTALCAAHPGVAAVLSGEAVAVPRGALLDVRDNAAHLNDMVRDLAASPYAEPGA